MSESEFSSDSFFETSAQSRERVKLGLRSATVLVPSSHHRVKIRPRSRLCKGLFLFPVDMRLIAVILAALLLIIQYPLWFGKGGWLRVHQLDQQVKEVQAKNEALKARNDKLNSEVQDLKNGTAAVEERARYELGMIRKDEIFVQVLNDNNPTVSSHK